ncbi:hypothetical protein F3B23_21245 [Bacteroides fragilis]|uniref:Uncharacterized protein n=1 Tax=Bacteroides fragilis TaxID=817 RepID=A0A5M5PF51_BACFG|nr:hypothetical protein F3B28_21720 [Bacteroides fragilis]KAA4705350.1 hypothetical protein F3B27_21095 [Bacteroides fragilis]KAA4712867.1 hypothetical protein F3B32_21895 [Bacteroides fragilis]KAA4724124.1 hypothetical protein F3B30_21335 [Bacteroides fragilis]KAA4725766.1 hypothetical protein F3B31_21420 [Bacteroides fragilis]
MNAVAELLPAFPPGHTSIYLKCYYIVLSFNSTTKGIEQKKEIKKIAKSICLLQKESVYLKYKKTQIWQTPNYREYPKLNKLCCMPN